MLVSKGGEMMACGNEACEPRRSGNGYVCIIVLYILLAIILGSCLTSC